MKTSLLFLPILISSAIISSVAQDVTGNLEGRILDAQGEPLPSTNIILDSPSLQGVQGTSTDADGYFRLLALPPGVYRVKISRISFQAATVQNVGVHIGRTTNVGIIKLQPQAVEMEQVVVFGERPLIDTRSTATGSNLTFSEIKDLPLQRNYNQMTSLFPQANETYLGDAANVSGSSGQENKYFVDGIDLTDPEMALTVTRMPSNFVKEIQLLTGGYEAEYKTATGGVVNVVTMSGSNAFGVQAFGFFTNNRLTGNENYGAVLEPPKGGYAQFDVGISASGPIVEDKLWFFAAYNPTFENEDILLPGLGYYPDKRTIHIFSGKLTWKATEKTDVVFTILGDPTRRDAVAPSAVFASAVYAFANPDPALTIDRTGGINFSLRGTHILDDNLMLSASFSMMNQKRKSEPKTERGKLEVPFLDHTTGIASGGVGGLVDVSNSQLSADIKATLTTGSHTLKAGLAYLDKRLDDVTSGHTLERGGPSEYTELIVADCYVSEPSGQNGVRN